MDNLVTITNTKKNTIQFDLSIEGLEANNVSVRFVVETAKDMELGFLCKQQDGDKWEVDIPEIEILEKTAYPYHIDVIADGYYFEPLKGTMNVVGSQQIYASSPKTKTDAPPKKKKATKKTDEKAGRNIDKKDTSIAKKPSELSKKEVSKTLDAAKKAVDKTAPAKKKAPVKEEADVHQIIQEAKEEAEKNRSEGAAAVVKNTLERVEKSDPIITPLKEDKTESEQEVEEKQTSEHDEKIRAILESQKKEKKPTVRTSIPFKRGDVVVH